MKGYTITRMSDNTTVTLIIDGEDSYVTDRKQMEVSLTEENARFVLAEAEAGEYSVRELD